MFICAAPGSKLEERTRIYGDLIKAGVRCGCSFKPGNNLKSLKRDLEEANLSGCKLAVIVGETEVLGENLTVKNLIEEKQFEVLKANGVQKIQEELGKYLDQFKHVYVKSLLEKVQKGEMELAEVMKVM